MELPLFDKIFLGIAFLILMFILFVEVTGIGKPKKF